MHSKIMSFLNHDSDGGGNHNNDGGRNHNNDGGGNHNNIIWSPWTSCYMNDMIWATCDDKLENSIMLYPYTYSMLYNMYIYIYNII